MDVLAKEEITPSVCYQEITQYMKKNMDTQLKLETSRNAFLSPLLAWHSKPKQTNE